MSDIQKVAEIMWCSFVITSPISFLLACITVSIANKRNIAQAWIEVCEIQRKHNEREKKTPGIWVCDGEGDQVFHEQK